MKSNKVKIGFISTFLSLKYGNYYFELLKEISNFEKVVAFTSNLHHYQYFEKIKKDVIKVNKNFLIVRYKAIGRLRGMVFPFNLFNLLKKHPVDILISNEYYQLITFIGLIFSKLRKIPFGIIQRRPHKLPSKYFILNWMGKLVVKNSSIIFSLTEKGRKTLNLYYKIPRSKIKVIPNSIRPENFLIKKEEIKKVSQLRKKLGIEKNDRVILFIGRIFKIKRTDLLIEIFARVKKKIKNSKLLIVGPSEPKEKKKLIRKIKELKLENDVILVGPVARDRIKYFYKLGDIFCLTSSYEVFGVAIIEAMASKVPVVVFNTGCVEEIIRNGYNGFLIEFPDIEKFSNTIIEVLKDNEIKRKIIKNGIKTVQKRFDLRKNTKKMLDVIKHVICYGKN